MKHIFFTLCFLCLTMMVVAQDNNTAQPSTALGIRFGRSVYGNVELGYGYKGLISAGIGYRF